MRKPTVIDQSSLWAFSVFTAIIKRQFHKGIDMKMIAFIMLLVSSVSFAGYSGSPKQPQPGVVIDAGATAVPQAYDTTAGSQLYTFLPSPTAFDVCNLTAIDIALKVNVNELDCASATGDTHYIPAGFCLSKENIAIGKSMCVRSLGAAIAVGIIYASVD